MADELWRKMCQQTAESMRMIYVARDTLFPSDTRSNEERVAKAELLINLLFCEDFDIAAGACLILAKSNPELDEVMGGVDGELDLRTLEGLLKVLAESQDMDMTSLKFLPDREMIADALFEYFRTGGVRHEDVPTGIEMLKDALRTEMSGSYDPYVVRRLEMIIRQQEDQYQSNENLPSPEDLE